MPWEYPKESKKRSVWDHLDRLPVRERKNEQEIDVQRASTIRRRDASPIRVLTSISAVMLTVTLVMGMLLFNSVSTLDGIENRLKTMDIQIGEIRSSVSEMGAGDTVFTQAPAENNEEGEEAEGDVTQ